MSPLQWLVSRWSWTWLTGAWRYRSRPGVDRCRGPCFRLCLIAWHCLVSRGRQADEGGFGLASFIKWLIVLFKGNVFLISFLLSFEIKYILYYINPSSSNQFHWSTLGTINSKATIKKSFPFTSHSLPPLIQSYLLHLLIKIHLNLFRRPTYLMILPIVLVTVPPHQIHVLHKML